MEGSHHLWVVGVGTPRCWWVDSGQLLLFVPILCHCSRVQGMGAPHFSCAVMPISCCGGQWSFVGGWSGCSLSLVGFCGLWVVVLCVIVVICGQLGFCLDGGWFVSFVGTGWSCLFCVVGGHSSWVIGVDIPHC